MTARTFVNLALILCSVWGSSSSFAQKPPEISELSNVDKQFMTQQRALINDLAAIKLGVRISGNRDRDLGLLQKLLDKRLVRPDQRRELQAMGVIMGDLLAADLNMHWVIYEDEIGRTRALRFKEDDNYLFPITMIARRQEADNHTPVVEIFQKAYDGMKRNIPALPFSKDAASPAPK